MKTILDVHWEFFPDKKSLHKVFESGASRTIRNEPLQLFITYLNKNREHNSNPDMI